MIGSINIPSRILPKGRPRSEWWIATTRHFGSKQGAPLEPEAVLVTYCMMPREEFDEGDRVGARGQLHIVPVGVLQDTEARFQGGRNSAEVCLLCHWRRAGVGESQKHEIQLIILTENRHRIARVQSDLRDLFPLAEDAEP